MMIWSRRQFVISSSLALAASGLRHVSALAQPETVTAFDELRRNVGIFTGRGGTIGWLVASDGLVVVDSQFPDTAEACLGGLQQRSDRQIDALINTHHHGDHTAGNVVFREAAKQIVAHANVPGLQKAAAERSGAAAQAYAETTFQDTWDMDLGGETVSAKHYGPGHTGGDIVVRFERANVAHMGDLMFHGRHPFVDRPSGASIKGWIIALEATARDLPADTLYIFGHAREGLPVTGDRANLMAQRDYFSAVLDHVEKGIGAGRSKDEITSLETLPGFADHTGNPPRLTLATVLGVAYAELTE